MKDRKIIKIEIPKVIWDAEMSIFNFRPIFKTWMESVLETVNKTSEMYSNGWVNTEGKLENAIRTWASSELRTT